MKFDYKDKNASRNELLSFLKDITHHPEIWEGDKAASLRLYEMWKPYLEKGEVIQESFPVPFSIVEECFPLEHTVISHKVVMYFNINNLNALLSNNVIPAIDTTLSRCNEVIHYTKMEDKVLRTNSFRSPVIVVKMASCDDNGKITLGEVVDGNHRVSAAIASGVDIPIKTLVGLFIPPFAFRNETSWALYHIVTGLSIAAGNIASAQEQEVYFKQLESFLKHCYVIN